MRFHEIAIGTRFEFEGMEYVKTDTLLATSKEGRQRLIRRSANLTPLDVATHTPASDPKKTASLDRNKTIQAFDVFYQNCTQVVGNNPELESARLKFLDSLK